MVILHSAFFILPFSRVRQLHDVIKETGFVIAPDVENIDLAFTGVGDWLEFLQAIELALVRFLVVEGFAMNNFYCAIFA